VEASAEKPRGAPTVASTQVQRLLGALNEATMAAAKLLSGFSTDVREAAFDAPGKAGTGGRGKAGTGGRGNKFIRRNIHETPRLNVDALHGVGALVAGMISGSGKHSPQTFVLKPHASSSLSTHTPRNLSAS